MVRIGMETEAARLGTFGAPTQPAGKGRPSAAKAKALVWPYSKPSPLSLVKAGFYFSPSDISPDNTACYLCERALDGWEEEDDPITEHLRHSSECGWAVMMNISRQSSNPSEIDDPTGPRIADARLATFCSWPHDGKRGWVCKSEKMAEAGWYFCPNEESEDLASCAYCNLSLDGWEPKDDPFDEHYRRSPDCSFFVFARPAENKPTKKGRGKASTSSKASRASIQSVATTVSDSQMELDDEEMDQSTVSRKSKTSTKGTKKGPKTKGGRGRKAKKEDPAETESHMEIDSNETEAAVADVPPTTRGRGKKRQSHEMSGIEETGIDPIQQEAPPKKRTTKSRTRNTAASVPELTDSEGQQSKPEKKRATSGPKKRGRSKARKVSATTDASKASFKSQLPDDAEIDAQLEAQLERDDWDAMDVEKHHHTSEPEDYGTIRKAPTQADYVNGDGESHADEQKPTKKIAPKRPPINTKVKTVPDSILIISSDPDFDMDNSIMPASPKKRLEVASYKNASRTLGKSKGTASKAGTLPSIPVDPDSDVEYHDEDQYTAPLSPPVLSRAQPSKNDGLSTSRVQEPSSENVRSDDFQIHADIASPQAPPAQECTPSPSPQASDAENRPPSTTQRNVSPSRPQLTHVLQASSIAAPSPSNKQPQGASLPTKHPWSTMDIDELLLGDPDDSENVNLSGVLHAAKDVLATPEKKMTVEEWIQWNAKNGEEKLRKECERLVSTFEREGGRAMRAIEGIECCD